MMRSPACITTATAIMTRCRGGISLRSDWAEGGGWNFYQYPLNPVINVDPQGLVDINLYPESDLIHSVADEINIPGVFTIGGAWYPHIY